MNENLGELDTRDQSDVKVNQMLIEVLIDRLQ